MLSLITFHIRITHFSWLVMTLQWGSGFMRWGSCSQGGVIEAIGPLKPKKVALFRNKSYYECHYYYQILLKSPHQKLLPGPTPVCSCCAPETSRCIYFQWRNAKLVRIKITIRGWWQELANLFLTFKLIILLPYYAHEHVCAIRVCICVWTFRFSEWRLTRKR